MHQVFYSSFELWTHKKDIHENAHLMSPEKAKEVLAAAERREREKLEAAKAPKRKLIVPPKEVCRIRTGFCVMFFIN